MASLQKKADSWYCQFMYSGQRHTFTTTAQMQESEEAESVSELAEKIKTVKAAHTIEAATQRAERKQAVAEEPVTARIRRKQESSSTLDQAAETNGQPGTPVRVQPETDENSPSKPTPTSFQDRIAKERERTQGPESNL